MVRAGGLLRILPRGFFDSNADGIGDFKGLGEKLDYLQWLGVDCVWLLPFYPSPLHDGGYDISDFLTVAPELGSVDDLAAVVEEAHRRGIRIISDLVMNHTSDEHPWFVESRSSRDNDKADWYMWADDDHGFADVRVIFCDVEPSNWTFDARRQQYYWHRFFHQQPDLNYDNPEVADAMLGVVQVLARPRPRRVPARCGALPLQSRGHQLREPAGDAQAAATDPFGDRRLLSEQGAPGGGQPVAGRGQRVLR